MSEQERFSIVVVKGSVRPGNYTGMAVDLVADELRKMEGISIEVVDPIGMDLKLPGTGDSGSAERLQELVEGATGVILSTPEYHGSYSAAIKLVIENMGFPSALAGKPVGLWAWRPDKSAQLKPWSICAASRRM